MSEDMNFSILECLKNGQSSEELKNIFLNQLASAEKQYKAELEEKERKENRMYSARMNLADIFLDYFDTLGVWDIDSWSDDLYNVVTDEVIKILKSMELRTEKTRAELKETLDSITVHDEERYVKIFSRYLAKMLLGLIEHSRPTGSAKEKELDINSMRDSLLQIYRILGV